MRIFPPVRICTIFPRPSDELESNSKNDADFNLKRVKNSSTNTYY